MKKFPVIVFVVFFASLVVAQVPKTISFQGYLTDKTAGDPLEGNFDMKFSIYDAFTGGTELWFDDYSAVAVSDGLYSVILGDKKPIILLFDKEYFLQVKVGLETLEPRITVTSSAYSLSSINASNITTGILQGSLVGTGVNAANVTSGLLDNARLDDDLQDLADDGTLSGSKIGSGIDAANITTNSLSVLNGGTGVSAITGVVIGNGANSLSGRGASAGGQYLRRNSANTDYEFGALVVTGTEITNGSISSNDLGAGSVLGGIGGTITDESITNADISTSAAIAGSKITPNFSAQNIVTTGSLAVGSGQVSVTSSGYAKLGASGVSVSASNPSGAVASFPSIRILKVTGTCAAADQTATVTLSGLTDSKIISITVLVDGTSEADYIPPGFTAIAGFQFQFNFNNQILYIRNQSGNSTSLAGRLFKAIIIYEE